MKKINIKKVFVFILLITTCYFLLIKPNFNIDYVSLENWEDTPPSLFREKQLEFERVRIAYSEAEDDVKRLLTLASIHSFKYDLFLRAFKKEQILEVWAKPKTENQYRLVVEYPFCKTSGQLGPKRKEGDLQIPEGFYRISHFNPKSNFWLSLKVNYPNAADKILSDPTNPGGDIYIHGGCQTVGCIPITNEKIQELYILAVEGHRNNQSIPIHIFPTKNIQKLLENDSVNKMLWQGLKEALDFFEKNHFFK